MEFERIAEKFNFFHRENAKYSFDPLTGVLTRESMESYINYLLQKKIPFTFGILDVDNFKTVNDTFGHKIGDKVLTETATYVCDKVGTDGVVARFGGDEFMLVFEGVSEYKSVWDIGHRINMGIGDVKFGNITGLSITVTIGFARYPLDAKNYDDLLEQSDKALYRGKMKGRNCFIIYLEEKHKNIDIKKERGKDFSSMYLCSKVFSYLTETEDISVNIHSLFKHYAAYFMYDHICTETRSGMNFEVLHALSKHKDFSYIDVDQVQSLLNNTGLVYISKVDTLSDVDYGAILSELKRQNICSTLYCKIAAFGKHYGYIRVDMTDTVRIWQHTEMDVIVIAANTIGLMLHYAGKTLEELDTVPPVTIATEQ